MGRTDKKMKVGLINAEFNLGQVFHNYNLVISWQKYPII